MEKCMHESEGLGEEEFESVNFEGKKKSRRSGGFIVLLAVRNKVSKGC